MAARIHLIEKQGLMAPVEKGSMIYESGYWDVSQSTAQKLVGGEILFHKKQAEPAYFGGVIRSFRVQTDGKWLGRIVFCFAADPVRFRGESAGRGGWSMEMKTILP